MKLCKGGSIPNVQTARRPELRSAILGVASGGPEQLNCLFAVIMVGELGPTEPPTRDRDLKP